NGTNIAAATKALLELSNVQPAQAGVYSLVVSNTFGVVTGAVAQLNVVPLLITSQPANLSAFGGNNISFSAGFLGAGTVTYQCQSNGANLLNATSPPLSLQNIQPDQSGFYTVIISNAFGVVTSQPARLDVATVASWGYNNGGLTNVPAGLSN